MENNTAMVLGSFLGDSLALGAHLIYDPDEIKKMGVIDSLRDPPKSSFHKTKSKGDFTNYGDQAMVMLDSMAAHPDFDLEDFGKRWQELFKGYDGYIDHATQDTIDLLKTGRWFGDSGSNSSDFSPIGRIAPIIFFLKDFPDMAVESSVAQAKMTHDNEYVIEGAEFFARVAIKVLGGMRPIDSMRKVAENSHPAIKEWVEEGINSVDGDTVEIINEIGSSCTITGAFPGTVHLIAKFEDDFVEALIQNTMAGGDSAARGMVAGMILGAHIGKLPEVWLNDLKKKDEILELLDKKN